MAIRCKLACANCRTVAAGHSEWFTIRDKPFIAFPRRVYPASYDRLLAACAERSLTLDIRQEASTETAILSLVSAAMGAAIVNAANRDRPRARVRFVDLQDLSVPLPLEFCFGANSANPALARFVDLLRQTAALFNESAQGAPPSRGAVDTRAREALAHFDRAIERLREGDWSGFGAELDALRPLLEALGTGRSDDRK